MTEDTSICLLCGEPAELSIHDIWTDGDFQLSTCCTGLLEEVSAEIDADPAWGRALLCHLGAEELTGHVLRRVSDGQGSSPVLDFKLRLAPVSFSTARAFIARHHRHCGPPHVIWTVKAFLILYLPRSRNERWPMCLAGTSHLVDSCLSGSEQPGRETGHSVRLAWPQPAVPLRSTWRSTYQPSDRPESTHCRLVRSMVRCCDRALSRQP